MFKKTVITILVVLYLVVLAGNLYLYHDIGTTFKIAIGSIVVALMVYFIFNKRRRVQ